MDYMTTTSTHEELGGMATVDRLTSLPEACSHCVSEFLTTLESYRLFNALGGAGSESSNFSSLSSIVVTTGEAAKELCSRFTMFGINGGMEDSSLQIELRSALEWACHDEVVKRDIRSIRMYGMLHGADFWDSLRRYSTVPDPLIYPEWFEGALHKVEVIHLDIVTLEDLHTINNLARDGFLRNLKSFSFVFDPEDPSSRTGLNRRSRRFKNGFEKTTSSSLSRSVSVRGIRDGCPHLEILECMNSWSEEIIQDFVLSTYDGSWRSLKTLDLGALRENALLTENYRIWVGAQQAFDEQGLGPFLVDRGADEETEAMYFALISLLRAEAFPSLEKIIVSSHDDTEDLSQFFFAWVTYDFHVKLAHLYDQSSPPEKEQIIRKTPRVRLYVDFFRNREVPFRCLPVSLSIKKLQLVCSQLSVDDLSFNEDYLDGNRGTDSFVYIERWRELMAWLRVKERHHPELFPLAIFPNLEEIESNCGIPYKEFTAFLKGSQHSYLPRMRLYAGSLSDSTTGTLLKHNSLINVGLFEVLPDMGAPLGYMEHMLGSIDWENPVKRALYRILRAYILTKQPYDNSTEGAPLSPLAWVSGPLMHVFNGNIIDNDHGRDPYGSEGDYDDALKLPWKRDAPAAYGPFRAHQPLLVGDCICMEKLIDNGAVKLVSPETLEELLAIHKGSSVQTFEGAWITAVKNGCFVNAQSLVVPDWILGDLCCFLARVRFNRQHKERSMAAYFPFDRRLYQSKQEKDGGAFRYEICDAQSEVGAVISNVSEMVMKDSIIRRVAQLFCHAPRLRHLTITTSPWSMILPESEEESYVEDSSTDEDREEWNKPNERRDIRRDTWKRRNKSGSMRIPRMEDSKWYVFKRDYVLLSFQALVEAVCVLRYLAARNPNYVNRDPNEPYMPDSVRYGDVNAQVSPSALPVAFGELECLELNVVGGHSHIYEDLREQLLQMRFDGVSGTTLPHKCRSSTYETAGNHADYKVTDAFTGGYVTPKLGDEVHRRMLRVVLSHGSREKTSIYLWKDKEGESR